LNIYDNVCQAVKGIRRISNITDPFRLCEEKRILVLTPNLGRYEDCIKGFFVKKNRIKTITVNSDLPEVIQRIILAHEFGHAMLHSDRRICEFHDVGLYDESSVMEKEANLFAGEFLLRDEDVLEAMNGDTTFFSAAAMLRVPAELLDFKFRVMKWKGYQLMEAPIDVRNNFLKNMEVPDNADYYC